MKDSNDNNGMQIRWAFLAHFPATGFVQNMATGEPVTYKRKPGAREIKRCDPYGIAQIVRVEVWEPNTHPNPETHNGMPTYVVLP